MLFLFGFQKPQMYNFSEEGFQNKNIFCSNISFVNFSCKYSLLFTNIQQKQEVVIFIPAKKRTKTHHIHTSYVFIGFIDQPISLCCDNKRFQHRKTLNYVYRGQIRSKFMFTGIMSVSVCKIPILN